jgi:UPF0716 family protein affecting phage T7 exclusion
MTPDCCYRPETEGRNRAIIGKLPAILVAAVLADLLLAVVLSFGLDWRPVLTETVTATAIGLAVIFYYVWRCSETVAERLETHPAGLDEGSLEKILLLVAGLMLLIPGVFSDVTGLVLLVPWVRRQLARRCLPSR